MTITAKIIADSISLDGHRVSTLELRYPRFIHAEFMTHRVFSRNASSSRAIPVERLIQDILDDTAMPIHWGKNQPGMQAREEHDAPIEVLLPYNGDGVYSWLETDPVGTFSWDTSYDPRGAWMVARDFTISQARSFHQAGYHKQIVNRLLEPFSHINVIVTATQWQNFFDLRIHPDAQPEIHELAKAIKSARDGSQPKHVGHNRWHLPYLDPSDFGRAKNIGDLKLISAARCARVSYRTHDGLEPDAAADLKLASRLAESGHMSPFEHQATPNPGHHANFRGWSQFRKELEQ